jgi:hypothetical protein
MGAKERAEALEELEWKCQEEGYLYTSGMLELEPSYSTVHRDSHRVGIDLLEKQDQAFSPSYDLAPLLSHSLPPLSLVSKLKWRHTGRLRKKGNLCHIK